MGKGNNIIANNHFHKQWETRVRTHWNQPTMKISRKKNRMKKARAVAPRPVKLLRPVVHCPTIRYHTKVRAGKGFTLAEIKASGINRRLATTIGIAVDARRRTKSIECLQTNSQRLKEYQSKLILFPMNEKKPKNDDARFALSTQVKGEIMPVRQQAVKAKTRVISENEKKFSAYTTVRTARADARLVGIRAKRVKDAAENSDEVAKDKKIKK